MISNLHRRALFAASLCFTFSVSALADWDAGDPHAMHYPQVPDVTTHGLDVLAGPRAGYAMPPTVREKFLADNWRANATGLVTDIHTWGSYNQNISLTSDPKNAYFSLVIYDNAPRGTGRPFSHPFNVLWSAYLQPTSVRLYGTAEERFYDPDPSQIVGPDTQIWQYNFSIPPASAFRQTAATIYWLGIHHSFDLDGDGFAGASDAEILATRPASAFGWKTSGSPSFEDDAVWTNVSSLVTTGLNNPQVVPSGVWFRLRYPEPDEPLDLAFVIYATPEPVSVLLFVMATIGLYGYRSNRGE